MTRPGLFFRLLLKAAWVRKDRALTALLSIAVVATMATAALTIYADLDSKLSREFRGFGANAIVTARNGSLNADDLAKIKDTLGGHGEMVPITYAIAKSSTGTPVVVAGTDLPRFTVLNSSWSITRVKHGFQYRPEQPLVGFRVAEIFAPNNQAFTISYGKNSIQVQVGAIFHSGSDDDSRIYLDRKDFFALTGLPFTAAQLRIDGTPAQVQVILERLAASLPNTEVKPVRQITAAQTAVLGRTRSIVITATAVVVVLIVLCMVATLTGSVLERRKDFAVMKALGASNRAVNLLFAGEALLVSLAGAIAGFLAGSAIAYWIGRANFGAAFTPRPELLAPVLLGSMILALMSAGAPLRLLRRIQPAGILRGE
jgi:putative ABC transport system permease protein